MINEQPDLKVIGAFSETEKSISKITELKPDVILIDLGLRSKNSLQIVKALKEKSPEIKVIVMDLMPVEDDILDFVKAGAEGFILKDAKVHEFLKTISSVAAGEKVLPSHMTGSLFSQIIERAMSGKKNPRLEEAVKMTKREREVVVLIADGLSNKEIGKLLHLSPFTVKSHVHNILEKMALHTRLQIANFAHTNKEFNYIPNTASTRAQ
jgi:DNA-binding NarL/FixJ family response regulator